MCTDPRIVRLDLSRVCAICYLNVTDPSLIEDGHLRRDGEGLADDLTRSQRMTDGDVATDGHRHRQPRTPVKVDHQVSK